MPFFEAVRLAWDSIVAQKLKSFFSLVGVLIGVTFLIAVVSIVQGMNVYMTEKFAGALIGVNTFLPPAGQEETMTMRELMRSSAEEKQMQIDHLAHFQDRHGAETPDAVAALQRVAEQRGNVVDRGVDGAPLTGL